MIDIALQLAVVVLTTISGLESSTVSVELTPNSNFSLSCDNRHWAPTCANCEDDELTFANYCFYYKHKALEDEYCRFRHFGMCKLNCFRKKCSNKKKPVCARCGLQNLSFRNNCELENFNCLYRNTCIHVEQGYCKNRRGMIVHQNFFEKSQVHNAMITERDIFTKN